MSEHRWWQVAVFMNVVGGALLGVFPVAWVFGADADTLSAISICISVSCLFSGIAAPLRLRAQDRDQREQAREKLANNMKRGTA